jgi:hypothetical protein
MDTVSREQVGFIPAVSRDSTAERAALNQTVYSPVVGAMASEALTVANVSADPSAQTINNVAVTITKAQSVPFGINGEETKGLTNAGTLTPINQQRIEQAMRTLTNEVEADLAALHILSSRAYGTYNGTPFSSAGDLTDFAQCLKILEDNGAPSDRHMVLGGTSVATIRGKQSTLFQANTGGPMAVEMLRKGALGEVHGMLLHNSAQVLKAVTTGTASGATTNAAGYAVGATTLTLDSAGTGTIIAGDLITFAGDTNIYCVKTGDADVSNGGTIVLQEPGLRVAMSTATKAITMVAATTRNMFFSRSAIQLATRAPAMPEGGDMADDVMLVTDPVSGLTYEFCIYKQKRQVRYEVNLAWGVAMVQPRHCGLLIGA